MTRRKTTAEHARECAEIGKVDLLSEYVNQNTKCYYLCKIHGEKHWSNPGSVRKGHGLKCCQRARIQKQADERKEKAAKEFDKKLVKFGRVKRIDPYEGAWTKKIRFFCLKHKETYLAWPGDVYTGTGLKCCLREIQAQQKKIDENAKNIGERMAEANPNLEWVSGEYSGYNKSTLKMRCKKHREVHPASPAQVLRGHGIWCCRIDALRRIGRASLNGASIDNVWRSLTNKLERKGSASIYLFESPKPGFNKYGISNNIEKRKSSGGYGKKLIEPRFYADRRDAVLIEQAFKYGYGCDYPDALEEWTGREELTERKPNDFIEIVEELEQALAVMGRWAFAEEYCNPDEVLRAKLELEETN